MSRAVLLLWLMLPCMCRSRRCYVNHECFITYYARETYVYFQKLFNNTYIWWEIRYFFYNDCRMCKTFFDNRWKCAKCCYNSSTGCMQASVLMNLKDKFHLCFNWATVNDANLIDNFSDKFFPTKINCVVSYLFMLILIIFYLMDDSTLQC